MLFHLQDFAHHRRAGLAPNYICCLYEIDRCSHPYRMRPAINGFSPGLKKCPLDTFLPRYAWPPLRIPHPAKRKATPNGVAFFLAEDEGFEPPQTESESGVLPLHKSSMCQARISLYAFCQKCQEYFSKNSKYFCHQQFAQHGADYSSQGKGFPLRTSFFM